MVRLYLLIINHLNMKNLLLVTLFITFILQGCEDELVYNKEKPFIEVSRKYGLMYKGELYSGKFIKYYHDGTLSKVEEKGSYVNGKMYGVWEYYHQDGQLSEKGSRLNGELNGVWERYRENGQLWYKVSYLNGKKNGVFEEYWNNQKLYYKGSYLNGKEEGVWEVYYENGQLWAKGSYINGKKNGFWEYYNEDGSLKSTETL